MVAKQRSSHPEEALVAPDCAVDRGYPKHQEDKGQGDRRQKGFLHLERGEAIAKDTERGVISF